MSQPRAVMVAGVTGSGKTTVGRALADRLGWRFVDADDLHTRDNVARMRRGEPLDDARRGPWLDAVRAAIVDSLTAGVSVVVACSALKQRYRDRIARGIDVEFVFLDAPIEVLRERLRTRRGHFAGPALLRSQFEALELPADSPVFDAGRPAAELVDEITRTLEHA